MAHLDGRQAPVGRVEAALEARERLAAGERGDVPTETTVAMRSRDELLMSSCGMGVEGVSASATRDGAAGEGGEG